MVSLLRSPVNYGHSPDSNVHPLCSKVAVRDAKNKAKKNPPKRVSLNELVGPESVLFLVGPILLVDRVIRGLNYVLHIESTTRDHI